MKLKNGKLHQKLINGYGFKMQIYFKYNIKKLSGYQKISQQNDINFLEKCKIKGFNLIMNGSLYVYFSIENQLYRLLKLSYLDNQEMEYQNKMLKIVIGVSKRIEKSDISDNEFGNDTWFNLNTYEYFDNEISLKRSENKERIRNHNRYYNQKYKLKR